MSKIMTGEAAKDFDSTTYRKVFEFIKENGIAPFLELFDGSNDYIIYEFLRGNEHSKVEFSSNCKLAMEFLEQFKSFFLTDFNPAERANVHQSAFSDFNSVITQTAENISNLKLYLENAKKLERLKINRIYLCSHGADSDLCNTHIFRKAGYLTAVTKWFTDGKISYFPGKIEGWSGETHEWYNTRISGATFAISTSNYSNGGRDKHVIISDFGFNGKKLPTLGELESVSEPKHFRKFRKNFFKNYEG